MASAVTNVFRSGSTKHKSKKETANLDLATGRPIDLLVSRGDQWKAIVKGLHAHYEGIAKASRHEGAEIEKHSNDLPLPFAMGAQFQQEGNGWQPTLYEVRTHTRNIAQLHEGLAKQIDTTVLADLDQIKIEVKQHVHNMHEEGVKKADIVDKERAHSTEALSKLGHSIATVGSLRSQNPTAHEDPYIAHSMVERQLAVQVQRENELQSATLRHQAEAERLEKDWSARIQKACQNYAQLQADFSEKIRVENQAIAEITAAVQPEAEWGALTDGETNYLIPTDAPTRDVNAITFPSQGHESAQAVKTGMLERKTNITKKYEEVYVVLTAAGFLHAYEKDPTSIARSDDPKSIGHPTLSLYLPNCQLGAPAPASSSKHKFGISGTKSAPEKNSKFKFGGKKGKDFTFRARSQADMLAWHAAIAQASGSTLSATPSSAVSQKGNVPSTVEDVGLTQDPYEDDSEEEEEEAFVEAPAGVTPAAATTAEEETTLPGYVGNGSAMPLEKKAPLDGAPHSHDTAGAGPSGIEKYPLAPALQGESGLAQDPTTSTSVAIPEGSTAHISVPAATSSAMPDTEASNVHTSSVGAALVEPEGIVAEGSGRTV